ncbi:hypothetical protein AAG570_011932 [Ranatra chinensis]|uniref:Uncharacterized protein n=1 Tax=Ranatra chinensis TaxID=642074 RepID=A0ABD0YHC4_9HEMI
MCKYIIIYGTNRGIFLIGGRKPPRVHLPPPPPPEVAPPPPPPLPEVAPPPPPPPEMAPPPPTAEPLPLTSSPSDPRDPGPHDARSHLLQEIRKGKILKVSYRRNFVILI